MRARRPLWFRVLWLAGSLLCPFALLMVFAHASPAGLGMLPLVGAGLAGAVVFAIGPWSTHQRIGGGLAYLIGSVFFVPIMALFAECSTGNCL